MTHDELLLVVNKYHADIENGLRWEPDCFIKALRAVVELHKPEQNCFDVTCYCADSCSKCGVKYPCPTIQAIEKELG